MMMNGLKRWFAVLAVALVAGCGGGSNDTSAFGGDAGGGGGTPTPTPTPTPAPTPTAADLVLVVGATSIASSGTETVAATVTAVDANRNALAAVPVTVRVDNGGIVTASAATTNTSGQISATVGIGSDRSNRTLTVTAVSGSITRTAQISVQDAGGTVSGSTPSDLLLTLSAATIPSNGTQTVTANVTALDAKRNVLPGVVISVSADQGATVAPGGTSTGSNGVLSAQVGTGGSATNRTITITATTAGLTRTAALRVVDVPSAANPTAADLSLSLSSGTLVNGGTSTVQATVTAVDANRNALAGIPVTISVDNSAVATVSGTVTNAQGVVTAAVGIGADRSNRSITVTASSGTVTKSVTFAVIGATLSASFSPQVSAGSAGNQIEYRLVDANGTPMSGQAITVSSPGLPSAASQTDSNGKFVYTYTAPATAGALTVVATAAGDTRSQQIAVQAPGNNVPNATSVPLSASLTPTPSVVSVNTVGSTTNQVELRALFLGANNVPVQNVRVRFSVAPTNSSDGTASQLGGSTYAYSDANGVARGTFTPGQRSSPTNGITVRACWDVADFDVNAACPTNRLITSTLTITSEALSVNIRTNNLVKTGAAGLTYIKEFVAMVVDAAGQAKPDVLITPSVDLIGYEKGVYVFSVAQQLWVQVPSLANTESYSWDSTSRSWVRSTTTTTTPTCPNEDVNRNGVREAPIYNAALAPPALSLREEDLNWNGDLEPRKADVAIKMVGSNRTDANGLAVLQIEYGQNLASWVDYIITVTASGISGTESRARYSGLLYGVGNLPYPATAVTDQTVPPAFVVSPYGRGTVCTDTN